MLALVATAGSVAAQAAPAQAGAPVTAAGDSNPLTPAERAWLARRGPIRLCVDPQWMPIEGIENGRHVGIGADLLGIMTRRAGIRLRLVPARTWLESYARGVRGECDIMSLMTPSPSRREIWHFATPHLDIPGVIATRQNVEFIASIEQVAHEPLGVMRGFSTAETLRDEVPGINLVEVGSYAEGLALVQSGELFGMIGNMISIGHAIREERIVDVKIAGRLATVSRLGVAVRRDEPQLAAIFDKLPATITPAERAAVLNAWLPVRFEQGFDRSLFWRAVGLFLLLGIIGVAWALTLRRLNRRLRAANEQLAELSRRDALTGLHNRMHFDAALPGAVRLASRNRLLLSVAMIDLDHFKDTNDTHGHVVGDACLRHVAAGLSVAFRRESDTVARFGGEEFAVIAIGGTAEGFAARAEDFRQALAATPLEVDGARIALTVSIGIWSGTPATDDDGTAAIAAADRALYEAKRTGRNRALSFPV